MFSLRWSFLLLSCGCASSQYPSLDEPMPPPETTTGVGSSSAPRAAAAAAVRDLKRADVERVVDAGLGRFLAHVVLEPRLNAGKFTGWTIVALTPSSLWLGVDLRPGDVVTQINGMAIEREMEAFAAFQAVRQAPALEVSFVRDNQPHKLALPIVGQPSRALPAAPASPGPAALNP